MYLDSLRLANFGKFREAHVRFLHPGRATASPDLPRPQWPNLNLILGLNGAGKSTLLKAIALAATDQSAAPDATGKMGWIRRPAAAPGLRASAPLEAVIEASFVAPGRGKVAAAAALLKRATIAEQGGKEVFHAAPTPARASATPEQKLLLVGYGATRRVEDTAAFHAARRSASAPENRSHGLFHEAHALTPLAAWLPQVQRDHPARFAQVQTVLNRLLAPAGCRFAGALEAGDYVFERDGLPVPFAALSDGIRALLGWVGDLLAHLAAQYPAPASLATAPAVVMVDEVDLHLHPEWQRQLLPLLARTLPKLQLLVTTHSPLVVGSVEWMNLILVQPGPEATGEAVRVVRPVHGLDADQVLLTEFFGLSSTRAPAKEQRLGRLTELASNGDFQAAKDLLAALSRGEEAL